MQPTWRKKKEKGKKEREKKKNSVAELRPSPAGLFVCRAAHCRYVDFTIYDMTPTPLHLLFAHIHERAAMERFTRAFNCFPLFPVPSSLPPVAIDSLPFCFFPFLWCFFFFPGCLSLPRRAIQTPGPPPSESCHHPLFISLLCLGPLLPAFSFQSVEEKPPLRLATFLPLLSSLHQCHLHPPTPSSRPPKPSSHLPLCLPAYALQDEVQIDGQTDGRTEGCGGGRAGGRREGGVTACVAVTDIKIFLRRGDSGDPGNDRAR